MAGKAALGSFELQQAFVALFMISLGDTEPYLLNRPILQGQETFFEFPCSFEGRFSVQT